MLLVTFHGGAAPGINNIYAYDTQTKALLNDVALAPSSKASLSELRSMVMANGYLYVANGGKSESNVLCYQPASGNSFGYISTLISASLSKKGNFQTAIAHPYGIVFDGSGVCYVSNQDTNVVAQVTVTNGQDGSLGAGCQSAYLNTLYPAPAVFLNGTYIASQNGSLHGVDVTATNIPCGNGGLGVALDSSRKVQNSVRDVAIANGILFVCDEPDSIVNLYSLTDGSFLGSSNALAGKPTHFQVENDGLYVSAGSLLYWGELPASPAGALLRLQQVALTPPGGNSIGGISFDGANVYIPFQGGTGGANGGSIYSYSVTQASPSTLPVFSNGTVFVASGSTTFQDTPEFVMYVAD